MNPLVATTTVAGFRIPASPRSAMIQRAHSRTKFECADGSFHFWG